MKLGSPVDADLLARKLSRFMDAFPIVAGEVARNYMNLAPYWKFTGTPRPDYYTLSIHREEEIEAQGGAQNALEGVGNIPFANRNQHMAFHLLTAGSDDHYFTLVADHKLFDAKGAEMFMDMFRRYSVDEDLADICGGIPTSSPAGLTEWMDKFRAGQAVNRKLLAMSRLSSRALPTPAQGRHGKVRFRHIIFDKEQTARIYDSAYSQAGYLMEMPYLLATVVQVVDLLFPDTGAGDSYTTPVTTDLRANEDPKQELFFNHFSFLMLQFPVEMARSRGDLIKSIKSQMFEQVRDDLPKKFAKASMLLRIAPFSVLDSLPGVLHKRPFSFSFAYLGKSKGKSFRLLESEVENIFHLPRVPLPPGLGIYFSQFDGRLNATISWIEGILQDQEVDMAERELRNRL